MVSRKETIFHLGEDGDEASKNVVSIRRLVECPKQALKGDEGLRVLIHQTEQEVKSRAAAYCSSNPSKGSPELGFLESCFLCKKELSRSKDVYMYRGDKGFCSEECRSRRILRDERRELETATGDRWKAPPHRRAGNKFQESDRDQQIPAVVV